MQPVEPSASASALASALALETPEDINRQRNIEMGMKIYTVIWNMKNLLTVITGTGLIGEITQMIHKTCLKMNS